MAAVTASSFTTSTHVSYGVSSRREPKTAFQNMGFGKEGQTHNGLRALNIVTAKSIAMRKSFNARSSKRSTVLFVGTEVAPWSKTGGLGDVLGGLPPAMTANGHRVMTVLPRYDQYKDAWDTGVTVELQVGEKIEMVRSRGTGVLNLNSNKYFSGPYGEDVIFVANDWHTALLPCSLKAKYQFKEICMSAKVAFCIHNITYQAWMYALAYRGLSPGVKGRKINWMKAGMLESNIVLTVSPYYAKELVSSVDKGVELDNVGRKVGVLGIVNGMEVQEWNPLTDKYTDVKYDATTVTDAKPILKKALQTEVGLPVDRNMTIPLIGFIGRIFS